MSQFSDGTSSRETQLNKFIIISDLIKFSPVFHETIFFCLIEKQAICLSSSLHKIIYYNALFRFDLQRFLRSLHESVRFFMGDDGEQQLVLAVEGTVRIFSFLRSKITEKFVIAI